LPVTVSVDQLDVDDLRLILTEPRNALSRQYERLFEMDKVDLEFTPEALDAAAELALKRETGARGLRSIIEGSLLDVMYIIPSRTDIRKVLVDRDAIMRTAAPKLQDAEGEDLDFDQPQNLPDAA
jgi:ATP-dependent Clp protease ATP-binding subunit ClpX